MTELAFELLRISFSNRYGRTFDSVAETLSPLLDMTGSLDDIVTSTITVMSLLDRRSDPCDEMLPRPGFSR